MLRSLLTGLTKTDHRQFDVTIVDNGSSDTTAALPGDFPSLDVNVIRNDENVSFSEACNQGISASQGDLVLFLNNDVEPLNPSWLGHMVAELAVDDVGAVGALLVYPEADRATRRVGAQHGGIRFGWRDGAPRPINVKHADATSADLVSSSRVPAVTAACLLVSREDLEMVGGFTSGFQYGWEDVDLCLKLAAAGRESVICGQAALVHQEFGTQQELHPAVRSANYRNNSALFHERWLPELGRRIRADAITGDGFWAMREPRVASIAVSSTNPADGFGDLYTAQELGAALRSKGWGVELAGRGEDDWGTIDPESSLVIALLPDFDPGWAPGGALTLAWVRNWVSRWVERPSFRHFDLVAAACAEFQDHLARTSGKGSFLLPLATNPERFSPGPGSSTFKTDLTFTGNAWGRSGRDMLNLLDLDPEDNFTIYGKNWDRFGWGQAHWRGHLPYELLPDLYRSAKVVLDDTAVPNRPALNSRVFDALASGSLVISDNVEGASEIFAGDLPTFQTRSELRSHVDRYLADDELRSNVATALREQILGSHTYDHRADQILDEVRSHLTRTSVALRIGPPTDAVANQWGDTHFARRFSRALQQRGFDTKISLMSEWDLPGHQLVDIAVHLRGLNPYVPKPNHFNVLWIISHPNDVTPRECERFDLVVTASEQFTKTLEKKLEVPVATLLQATDPGLFQPRQPSSDLACEAVFVGNTRGQRREIVYWALEAGIEAHVYGTGWEGLIPAENHIASYYPNNDLASLYSSADVVLSDHWPDMAEHGFVSNRVLDALACNAYVITDGVAGVQELSPHNVGVAHDAADVRRLFDGRRASTDSVHHTEEFARSHSFSARADEFVDLLDRYRR